MPALFGGHEGSVCRPGMVVATLAGMNAWNRPVVGVRLPPWATFAQSVFHGLLDYMRLHGRWE